MGKTTTAINLSASLALSGKKVLLIDIDPQGNASSGLGIDGNSLGVYELLMGEASQAEVVCSTEIDTLKIIPSRVDLTGAEIELVSREKREKILKTALNGIIEEYEFVVIDCPSSLGLLTLNALAVSNSVLIPMQCEYYALEGLTGLLETIEKIRKHLNSNLKIEGLLRTMYDPRNNLATQVSAQLIDHFGEKVYRTIIPRNVRLAEAPSHGIPVLIYDSSSAGSLAYLSLAGEMLRSKNKA